MFHATSYRHLMLQHLGPPYSTSEITWHCSLPRHHHFTPPHLEAQRVAQPQSTSRTIPHPQLCYTIPTLHSIFHTTPDSTSHYTTTSWFYITTSDITTLCIIFHIWHYTTITQHIAYATFFSTTIPNYIPHCISTIIPHHTMPNMASNHSTSLGIPQPRFTSCITVHHYIPHAHHYSTSHHHNTSSDIDITCSITPYRTYSARHHM